MLEYQKARTRKNNKNDKILSGAGAGNGENTHGTNWMGSDWRVLRPDGGGSARLDYHFTQFILYLATALEQIVIFLLLLYVAAYVFVYAFLNCITLGFRI